VTNGGSFDDFIPLIPKRDPNAPPGGPPDLGIRTNTLALAHVYMQQGWHPAPVHSFTLPLWFGGLYDEQRAARQSAAIFDRSHLGRFYVTGERAVEVLSRLFASDIPRIPPRGMRRVLALREDGTILDIPTVWHLDPGRWLVVTGPQTQVHLPDIAEATVAELGLVDQVLVRDRLTGSVMFSVQGPQAAELLEAVVGTTIPGAVPEGEAHELLLGGYRALVAHTSQIAEDGYWFVVSPEVGEHFWENSVSAGIVPSGLAAHDALRIEAGVLEAPYETPVPATPAAAGLASLLDGASPEATGAAAANTAAATERAIRSLKLTGRGLASRGDRVYVGGENIGACVNAAYSAFLEASIALAYLPPDLTRVEVEVDGVRVPAEVHAPPLVRPPSERDA
jgi:aminomethyltransferase